MRPPARRAGRRPCASPAPTRPSPAPGVLDALADADVGRDRPSNPIVSIGPVLAVPGVREPSSARRERRRRRVADRRRRGAEGPGRPHARRARPRVVGRRRGPALRATLAAHARDRRRRRRPGRRGRGRGRALRRRPTTIMRTPERRRRAGPDRRSRPAPDEPREPARDPGASRASARSIPATTSPAHRRRACRRRTTTALADGDVRRRHPEDRVEGRGPAGRRRPRRPAVATSRSSRRSRCASCAAAATSSSPRPGTASCAPTPASTCRTSSGAGPRCCPIDSDRSARRIRDGLRGPAGVEVGVDRVRHVRAHLAARPHRRRHRLRRRRRASSTCAARPTPSAARCR